MQNFKIRMYEFIYCMMTCSSKHALIPSLWNIFTLSQKHAGILRWYGMPTYCDVPPIEIDNKLKYDFI